MAGDATALALGSGLALISGAAWASLDAIRKHLGQRLSPLAILLGISLAQLPVWAALIAVQGLPEVGAAFLGWTALAAAIAVAANALLIRALALSPLSLTTPYLSFTPVATLLTGGLLLGQRPSLGGVAGVATVVAGAFLLNASSETTRRHPLAVVAREPGSRLALLVALLFALGNAVDRRAVLQASEAFYAGALTLAMCTALLVPRGPRRALAGARGSWRWLALGGALTAAALLAQLLSFRFLFVAYTDAVKRAGGNLVAVWIGAMLFAEGSLRQRLVAVAVMSAGVALILLG